MVKMSITMRLFNSLNLKNFTIFGKVQNITKEATSGQDKLFKQITGKTIPSFIQLGVVLAGVAAALAALIVAFKLFTQSMSFSEKGADRMAIASGALTIAWDSMVKAASSVTDAVIGFGISVLEAAENTGVFAKITSILVKGILGESKATRDLTKDIIALNIERTEGNAELVTNLNIINNQLADVNISEKERIRLIGERALAQGALSTATIPALEKEIELLNKLNINADFAKQTENNIKIAELTDKIALANQASANALARAGVTIKNILNPALEETKKKVEEIAELLKPEELEFFGDETAQFLDAGKELADVFKDIQDEFKQDVIDGFDAIEEAEEEHIETRSKTQERGARARLAWEELGVAGQLQLGAELLSAGAEIAQENFELQKAFAIGETLVSTAAGIIKVWRDPGYPLAIPLTALVAATGAASLASINAAQPGQTGTVINPIRTANVGFRPSATIESASSGFFRDNAGPQQAPQVVLVTEDLNHVQNRVAVTESRASIG